MIVEVCANSYNSAIIAKEAGIQRIELCQNLMVGGLTPSPTTIMQCVESLNMNTQVLVRPRSGDFCYDEEEIRVTCGDIIYCREMNIDGVVVGSLEENGEINYNDCAFFKEAAQDMTITFHRAFDFVPDPFKALDALIELGYDRVLTSGQQSTAFEGRPMIRELVEYAGDKITILAGGGINSQNVLQLIKETKVKEIHLSAKGLKKSKATYASQLPLNSTTFPEYDYYETSKEKLEEVLALIYPR